MKEVLPWLVSWARRAGTRDLAALSAQYKLFTSSPYTILIYVSPIPIAQQPGHAVVQGRLSLNVCLRS